ncbi:biofilm formation protein PslG [Deinococcus cellulosilyticus NBRC 106333 = KACC 11606]|uniref:Biofilm formation protein PslG n=2 Tax=Deinococcus cellulosilyticus TaxID=401558 RepID=A0A511NAL3_DEIC1|nr:biofilm formation protein PslG [Deinococcus cellulosilyticus NBRC 106333 = KACC 11606]
MQQMEHLGLKHFRMDLHWDLLEPEKGTDEVLKNCLDPVMQKSQQHHLDPLLFLTGSAKFASRAPAGEPFPDTFPPRDPSQYTGFLKKLALRYPQVQTWQVWNEPNLPSSWRTSASTTLVREYGDLLQSSAKALKGLPTEVMTAGFAYWSELPEGSFLLKHLQDSRALEGIQTVAYHPYTFQPEGITAYSKGPDFFLNRTKMVNETLKGWGKRIWATEFGWSTYPGPVEEQPLITPEEQADFLLRRIVLSAHLGFDRIYLFTLTDLDGRASLRDQFYGLLDVNGQPKPAFTALRRFLDVLKGDLEPVELGWKPSSVLHSRAWKRTDGRVVVAFWGNPQVLQLSQEAQVLDPLTGRSNAASRQVEVKTKLQLLVLPHP